MPRSKKKEFKNDVGVDPRFQSALVQKLINTIMKSGKKSIARAIVYDAFDIITKKSGGDSKKALDVFNKAYDQVVPRVEVRSRRVGGSVYQVPREVDRKRQRALALRWLIDAARKRSDKDMGQRLAYELLAAGEGTGSAVKQRLDVQKLAEANRAFSHFAW